jgi:hypothetical protein
MKTTALIQNCSFQGGDYLPKLCDGTRLKFKHVGKNLIEATILTGYAKGEIFIPRIQVIPSDYLFEFKRLQFPLNYVLL